MNRKRLLGIAALGLCVCALGCNKTKEQNLVLYDEESELREQPSLEDLFNLEEIEAGGSVIDGAYRYGLRNIDDENMAVSLSDGKLALDIEHENSGKECEVGFLMFVDGIPQMSTSGESMTKFRTESKSITRVSIVTEPIIDKERNVHRLDCMLIFEPNYTGTKEHMEHGNYGSGLPLLPYTVDGTDDETGSIQVDKAFETVQISSELAERYTKEQRDGTKSCQIDEKALIIELREKESVITDGILADSDTEFTLAFFGKSTERYRISAFLNNESYPAFNGVSYVDIEVVPGYETILRPSIRYEDLQRGGNNLFFVYIPMGNYDIFASESAEKTPTYTVLRGE